MAGAVKLLLGVCFLVLIVETYGQRYILPTFRPPAKRPVLIRTVRNADRSQPKWLYEGDIPRAPATGDHPYLPPRIDDIKLDPNRRYV